MPAPPNKELSVPSPLTMAEHLSFETLINYFHPVLLVPITNKDDTLTYMETIPNSDAIRCISPMKQEVLTLIKNKVFDMLMKPTKVKIVVGV